MTAVLPDSYAEDFEAHVRRFFAGHECATRVWRSGRFAEEVPDFRVLEVGPGPGGDFWTYVSVGAAHFWGPPDQGRTEFVLVAPQRDATPIELVTMLASYHRSRRLGWGHTVPIGQPWLTGATCDVFLICKPYPFGPDLEIFEIDAEQHVHALWVLPVTAEERSFKAKAGLEALEQRFDDAAIEYWDPKRPSVV